MVEEQPAAVRLLTLFAAHSGRRVIRRSCWQGGSLFFAPDTSSYQAQRRRDTFRQASVRVWRLYWRCEASPLAGEGERYRMSTMDSALVVFAVIDVVAIATLAYVGAQMMETAQTGKKRLQPVLDEANKLTSEGKAVAQRATTGGKEIIDRVKATVNDLKSRTNRTKR